MIAADFRRDRLAALMEADQNGDGKLDFEEFKAMVANTDIAKQMVSLPSQQHRELQNLTSALLRSPQTLEGVYARPDVLCTTDPRFYSADMW